MFAPSNWQRSTPMTALNTFLRKVLLADAAISAAAALAMVAGADLTHALFGLPSALIFWSGVALAPFIATLAMIGRARAAPRGLVIAIIAINFAWVAASLYVA